MTSSLRLQVQEACDDLFCDPDDAHARSRALEVLGMQNGRAPAEVVSRRAWRRLVKIACDELHDDPEDDDARNRLLLLVLAGGGSPEVAA
jgi:hypothetical protein